jgi:hypothetical protein
LSVNYVIAGEWKEADSSARWSHPVSSELVTRDRNNDTKMLDHEKSKSRISRLTNFEVIIYLQWLLYQYITFK